MSTSDIVIIGSCIFKYFSFQLKVAFYIIDCQSKLNDVLHITKLSLKDKDMSYHVLGCMLTGKI